MLTPLYASDLIILLVDFNRLYIKQAFYIQNSSSHNGDLLHSPSP